MLPRFPENEVRHLADFQARFVDTGSGHWVKEECDFDPEALLHWLGTAPMDEVAAYFEDPH